MSAVYLLMSISKKSRYITHIFQAISFLIVLFHTQKFVFGASI